MNKCMVSEKLQRSHIFFIFITFIIMPLPAFSYLDPTTGSMVISAIVGLFASLVLAIKTYWYRIKAFFKPKAVKSDTDESAN